MNQNKALWEKGDFTRIAESMRDTGEALVEGLGIRKDLKVMDLGCGDGTTALPLVLHQFQHALQLRFEDVTGENTWTAADEGATHSDGASCPLAADRQVVRRSIGIELIRKARLGIAAISALIAGLLAGGQPWAQVWSPDRTSDIVTPHTTSCFVGWQDQ